MGRLSRFVDPFIVFLIATVLLASVLPPRGAMVGVFSVVTDFAIALLFFLHGAKLSRQAIVAGIGHWRLLLAVLASTFVLFPLLGVSARWIAAPWAHQAVLAGVVYLCLLPSTVQSSIAFTTIAGGNVPAAICSATLSNVLGVLITPALVTLCLHPTGAMGAGGVLTAVKSIAVQLLAPFILGHLSRPLLVGLLERHKRVIGIVDRGSILLVVYTAFGAAVVEGLWGKLTTEDLVAVLIINAVILLAAVAATMFGGRLAGFSRPDRVALVFCGSKKSMVTGVPMAGVLFPAAMVGGLILPLMIFHQMQMMLCAFLARRYAAQAAIAGDGDGY